MPSCLYMNSPEGTALHILATESHVDAFLQEGAKRHVLAEGPVHLPLLYQVGSAAKYPGHA